MVDSDSAESTHNVNPELTVVDGAPEVAGAQYMTSILPPNRVQALQQVEVGAKANSLS